MSDDDRLADYFARQPTDYRTLSDGCQTCGYSRVYCHCVLYMDSLTCCPSCSHT